MRLLLRLIKQSPKPLESVAVFEELDAMLRRRSANICLASHGASRREKDFARRWT